MAYTEKVSLSGTALSFLLYECNNSANSQEGFLLGNITSEITNHISDSNSDNARLDTQIIIKTVLPLPSVSLFYCPTGRIKEDVLSRLLSSSASEVVGWYKYRKNTSIKPTFRDKLISKGLQKYFENNHGKKTFVTCNLSNKTSSAGSTHTFTYRFGKINCFDMFEYIEDVTANLGEKLTGYKKVKRTSLNSVFNKIIDENNVQSNTNNVILCIQEAVDVRLKKEAKIASKNEIHIRELEAEIKQMSTILSEKLAVELQAAHDKLIEENRIKRETEMAEACFRALKVPPTDNVIDILTSTNHLANSENSVERVDNEFNARSSSPVLGPTNPPKQILNYASALKNHLDAPSTSTKDNFSEDLISFDLDENQIKKSMNVEEEVKCFGGSSPEY